MKCKHRNKCPFIKAYGYCLKQIGENCNDEKRKEGEK